MAERNQTDFDESMQMLRQVYEAIVGHDEEEVKRSVNAALILAGFNHLVID